MQTWVFAIIWIMSAGLGMASAAEPATVPAGRPAAGEVDFDRFPVIECEKATGYRGIWYANEPMPAPNMFKYSGGLGTYSAKHIPIAYYAAEVEKTFFVYGGTSPGGGKPGHPNDLWIMISYYDHKTGLVPRPRKIMDKETEDAHDNPVLMLDDKGHIWVFVAAHGTARPAYIYRSVKPYDIDAFQLISETNFSYPQPWYIKGKGFLFLHTRYVNGERLLHFMTSPEGVNWSEPKLLAAMGKGHYQISWMHKDKVGTAFNYHPEDGGLNARTNLYYLETRDFGATWQTANGEKVELPLRDVKNPAIVRAYESMDRLVYLKDMNFTAQGRPVVMYLLAPDFRPGPGPGRRTWYIARHFGKEWMVSGTVHSDHNYDMGSLYLMGGPRMEIIAPIATGPQAFDTGGEMTLLWSDDSGKSWRSAMLTRDSYLNHSYARRPVHAHPHFRALWADGHARQSTISRLYYCDADGATYRLPREMEEEFAKPNLLPIGGDVPLTAEELGLDPEDLAPLPESGDARPGNDEASEHP